MSNVICPHCRIEFRPEDVGRAALCPVCGGRFDGRFDGRVGPAQAEEPAPAAPRPWDEPPLFGMPRKRAKAVILAAVFGVMVVLSLAGVFERPAPRPRDPAIDGALDMQRALPAIKAEPKVISALTLPGNPPTLVVRVRDDGTPRDGYAGYLALLVREHRVFSCVVEVRDVDKGEVLGRASCPR